MSYHNNPTEPKLKLPAGACDAHFHVFGPKMWKWQSAAPGGSLSFGSVGLVW